MPDQDHPLSSSTRRRATSITSRASVVSFDSHHGSHHHSVLPPVHSPRDRLGSGLHEGYFDARRTSHDSTRRPRDGSMSTAPSKSPLLGSSADITSARGRHLTRQARVDATELSGLLGMGPARSPIRLPRALIGIGRQEHALVTTRFEVMGEEEMKGYFEGSGSRRTSEVHSPVKGITYSEQASNPTSLPSTSTTSTHTSAPSPNPSTPDLATDAARFESPTTPRPRTFRRTTTLLAHPLPSPAIDIPLFPPSPPASNEIVPTISREGPQEKNARKSIDSTGEIGGREREALRILSRIVRELIDVCVGLEEENDALKSQAIEGKDVSRGGIIESRIDGRGDGESVLEAKISGENDADVASIRSVHDSLAEAISTSLNATDMDDAVSVSSHHVSNKPASFVSSQKSELQRPRRTSSLVSGGGGLVPSPAGSRNDKTSMKNSASWAANLWSWTSGPQKTNSTSHSAKGKVRERDLTSTIRAGDSFFAPRSPLPVVETHLATAGEISPLDSQDDEQWKRRGSSPAFRAIFLATRIVTPDPSSVLQSDLSPSGLLAYLAHSLVTNAQEEGITVREPLDRSRRASASRPKDGYTSPTMGEQAMQITASLSNALAGKLDPRKFVSSKSNDARKSLLRTLSSRPETTPDGTTSPKTPVTPSSHPAAGTSTPPSPTRVDMPAVELNSIGAWSSKPPSLLPRRNTLGAFLRLEEARPATQFNGKNVKPYTDPYGFVYDLKHIQALVDAQSARTRPLAMSAPKDDWEDQKRDPTSTKSVKVKLARPGPSALSSDDEARRLSDLSVRSTVQFISEESHSSGGVSAPNLGTQDAKRTRARSATIATLGPGPVKPAISEQSLTVSSSGAVDLEPTVTAGPLRSKSGTIRQIHTNRTIDTAQPRKPTSALLTQLTETHDKEEGERLKRWEAFLQVRRDTSVKTVESSSWQGDLLGLSQMGSGKTGVEARRALLKVVRTVGIPLKLRAQVWAEFSGAKEAFEPGVYGELLAKTRREKEDVLAEIEKDVSRTFASNVFFGGDGVGCQKLRRLLTAFAAYDPSIGYCQGLNLLAATLLLIHESEENAFWTFKATISILPEDFYAPSLLGSRVEQAVLQEYVEELLPEVADKLEDLGLELSTITFGWLLSLFVNCLPIETVFRVWDCFYAEGNDILILTSLAILKLSSNQICSADTVSEVFEVVHGATERMWNGEKLIELQHHLQRSVKKSDIQQRRKGCLTRMS